MLEPSDRIRLIKETSRRLAEEEWPLIDLTLKQFSLPWSDTWPNNNRESYIVQMIENATDNALVSLARHVGYDYDAARPKVEPNFWIPSHFRLFISHLMAFCQEAAELQAELKKYQISSFVAHNDIEPTTEWQNEIEAALATCDGMVALLREDFHKSYWTDQEIGYAMGRNILVVAVRQDQDPYGFIRRFQALNGNGKHSEELAREIFDILQKHKQTRHRVAEALIARLEQSLSFASAKRNLDLLEGATYWEPSFTERCRVAIQSNNQIRDSYGVSGRIEKLIARWEAEGV